MRCIFLHGLGQTADSWTQTVRAMHCDLDIHCPNLSDWLCDGQPTYTALYHALEKYCAQFDEPIGLCGLSLGGVLVLQYVIDHPEKVDSFVLIGTQYTMPRQLLKIQNLVFRFMPNAMFQKMGFQKKAFIQLSRSMMDLDFEQALCSIRRRGLMICGEKDRVNRSAALRLQERITQSQIVILPQAGHEVNVDNPQALGQCLSAFFTAIE